MEGIFPVVVGIFKTMGNCSLRKNWPSRMLSTRLHAQGQQNIMGGAARKLTGCWHYFWSRWKCIRRSHECC